MFKIWFTHLFLSSIKDRTGPVLLFGDNLSSHFSWELVELARKHQVYFVMIIANATNWLQVLDVSVFAPMGV